MFTSREVLEQRSEGLPLHDTQINLHAVPGHYASLGGAVAQYLRHLRQGCQRVYHALRVRRRAHQVDVPNGLLKPAQASGGLQLLDRRAPPSQGVHYRPRRVRRLSYGHPTVFGTQRAQVTQNVVRRLLAQPGHLLHPTVLNGLFQVVHSAHTQLIHQPQRRLWPYAGDVHDLQQTGRKLRLEGLVELQATRVQQFAYLLGNGVTNAV